MDNTLHDPFKLEERLSHKIDKADVLLPLVMAGMLWTAGLVDLISHVSPAPQLFGIWSIPFFLALIVYALGFVGLYWLIVPRDSLERVQAAIGYVQQRAWLGLLIVAAAGALIFTILIWDQWLYFPLLSVAMLVLAVVVVGMFLLVNGTLRPPMQLWRKVLLGILAVGLLIEVALQVTASLGALPGYRNLSGLFVPYGHIYQHEEGFGNDGTNRYGYYYPEFELGSGARHILLKGDTFVQGLQVGHDDLFGVQLERQLDAAGMPASVMGLGNPGYGPGLYADTVLYPFTDAPLKPDEVVVFFHLANDLQVQTSPTDGPRPYYFVNAEGKVEIDPGSYISRHDLQHMIVPGYDPINLVRTLESRSLVLERFMAWWRGFRGQPDPVALLPSAIDLATADQPFGPATFAFRAEGGLEADHAFTIATGLLDNYRARLAEDGVALRIVTIPYFPPAFYAQGDGAWTSTLGEYDLFTPERALVAYAQANGIDILPLGAELQASGLTREQVRALFFREGSGHFTPAGHTWVAQAVYENLYAP
jgi:hypothetical protein